MRILYSCLSKSWGGMEMFTLTSIKLLLNRDVKVELICIAESRLHIEASNMGLIIYPLKASGYLHPYSTIKLSNIIRKGNYDVIHTHASKDLWLLVPALKLIKNKIPLILTKHVGSSIIKKDILHKWIYGRLTFALAISNVIKKNIIDTCPLPEENILLLHDAIDTQKFNPEKVDNKKVKREFGFQIEDVVIGMLARFSPGKGHEEFLSAAAELNKKHINLKFLVVGEASRGEDNYADSIKQLAKDLNLNNLIFTGYRSDIPEVLKAMDIFVFPSHSEAFGIALIEAMSMGLPSVCSNSDGVLDIAVDNETSFLFESRNQHDLFKMLDALIDSKDTRIRFGKAARKRAIENFDDNFLTDKILNIYELAMNKGK